MLPLYLALLLVTAKTEIYNFDYQHNGEDWQQQAPPGTHWEDCSSKTQQSPIEISKTTAVSNDSYLFVNFYPQKGLIYWYNTTVYIRTSIMTTSFGQVYTRTILGEIPALRANEIRIRAHAEHKFEGIDYYDLELQIYCTELYTSYKNTKLAFAFMFQVGNTSDPALEIIKNNYIPANDTVPFPSVNATMSFTHLLSENQPFDFYYYLGSITIPPCFKGKMNWIIPKKIYSMSQEQRDFFHNLFNNGKDKKGNWRALQPLNGNPLNFYQQGQ